MAGLTASVNGFARSISGEQKGVCTEAKSFRDTGKQELGTSLYCRTLTTARHYMKTSFLGNPYYGQVSKATRAETLGHLQDRPIGERLANLHTFSH
jgi:hypothetical protein